MRKRLLLAALGAAAFAGCSGGGGGSPITNPGGSGPGPGSGSGTQAVAASAIADTNALGSPIKDFTAFDRAAGSTSSGVQTSAEALQGASGVCRNGVEFYAPDKNGDANSTETIDFYDTACAIEARDTIRIYTATGTSSESVNVNQSLFAPNNTTPIATRTDAHTVTNATFNQYGYPVAASGFDLVATGTLNIAGARTIASGREFIMQPGSNGSNGYCSDSAGYNATGIPSLDETFGWAGGVAAGTRAVNADGSVTWTATHAGTAYKGSIGGLSILTGTQNTTCPIGTPMFTLGGGTAIGTYNIPVVATFLHGMLENLAVTNATLTNGDTLNITTNTSQPSSSSQYITGIITSGSTQIATFAVDAYGNGTLIVTKTGAQFVITDWHVVR